MSTSSVANPGSAASWEEKAAAKRAARDAKIPEEWKLSADLRKSVEEGGPLDVTDIPRTCGLLSEQELEITESDIQTLVDKLQSGAWKSYDVTLAFCKRAAIACQLVNCLTEIFFDEGLARAKELDGILEKTGKPVGPLHGLPVSLKDNFKIKGLDSTVGYIGWIGRPEQTESAMTELMRDLGAVLYVKTNVPSSLMSPETFNNIYGYTPSPWNRKLSSGGSSGGEAALIAMKDIGGSVRIPAACCNLFGLRPSFGRFPTEGHRSAMPGQESIRNVNGPLSGTIEGIELFAKSIVGKQAWLDKDPRLVPIPWREIELPQKLSIGVVRDDAIARPHPPIQRGIQMAVDALRAAGHEIVELEFDTTFITRGQEILSLLYGSDAGVHIREALQLSGEPAIHPIQRYSELSGDGLTAKQLWATHLARDAWNIKMAKWWNDTARKTSTGQPVDGLLMATTPYASPEREVWAGKGDLGYTSTWNLADYSAITIPVTRADPALDPKETDYKPRGAMDKMTWEQYDPELYRGGAVAVQIVGRRLQEEKVVGMAKVLDRALRAQSKP